MIAASLGLMLRSARSARLEAWAAGIVAILRDARLRPAPQDEVGASCSEYHLARLCRAFAFCGPAAGSACLRRLMFSHGSRRRRVSRFGRLSTVNAFEIFCAP